jgi:hypothetical protein
LAGNPATTGADLDLTKLSISSIAHLCRKSTDLFFQGLEYDDRACLELFRRATQKGDELAWEALIRQYNDLVISWVLRHPYFPRADEEPEYFANRTFGKFWYAFNRDPDKLQKFVNVKTLLQYLKLCANSAVKEYVERKMSPQDQIQSGQPVESIPNAVDPIGRIEENITALRVWQYILSAVKNEQERIVAEDYLIYDLKPREIFARHREAFDSISQVSRVKENLMARLRRDKQLEYIFSAGD